MIKQRICIVGDGLSGLMTAVVLAKVPGIEVYLIAKKVQKMQIKGLQLFQIQIISSSTKILQAQDQSFSGLQKKSSFFTKLPKKI